MSDMTDYENTVLCAQCGGKCCKKLGGAAVPDDIIRNFGEPLERAVERALASNDWVVDWWEGDPRRLNYNDSSSVSRGYYLRPRSAGDRGNFCPSWGGQCLLLADAGCTLPLELRPITCRALEPVVNEACVLHTGGKRKAAVAWLEYHTMIKNLERKEVSP